MKPGGEQRNTNSPAPAVVALGGLAKTVALRGTSGRELDGAPTDRGSTQP